MRRKLVWIAPLAILGFLLFIALGGVVVRLLWNWLLPPLVGWPEVTFWQALGVLALCRILFGGLGCHGRSRPGRWDRMTDEERERIRLRMRERFGFRPPPGDPAQTAGN
jgi:hypothetical protein